jgi:hypothetical protein
MKVKRFSGLDVTNNRHKDGESGLNSQILSKSVTRKEMEDLCERPRKLIHKELQSHYLETFSCKDLLNIRRNNHKVRSSKMLPISTDTEATQEVLC